MVGVSRIRVANLWIMIAHNSLAGTEFENASYESSLFTALVAGHSLIYDAFWINCTTPGTP